MNSMINLLAKVTRDSNFYVKKVNGRCKFMRESFIAQRYQKTFVFLSSQELAYISIFFLLWLFPLVVTLMASIAGYKFSYEGLQWQNKNQAMVGLIVCSALSVGLISSAFILHVLKSWPSGRSIVSRLSSARITMLQMIAAAVIAAISLYGVVYSFGGFMKIGSPYDGANYSWLGSGGWSIALLFSVALLMHGSGVKYSKTRFLLLPTLIYSPVLLFGSRIDYISLMIGSIVFMFIAHRMNVGNKFLFALLLIFYLFAVSHTLANLRYLDFIRPLDITGIQAESVSIPRLISAVGTANYGRSHAGESDMFYLSTIGDIGASVFQVVGISGSSQNRELGYLAAVCNYAVRLLPGPLFFARPGDLSQRISANVGGGALHSLGEGFFIDGIIGCLVVTIVFSLFIAISAFLVFRAPGARSSPLSCLIIQFPWLLLIRGGWYQFFSLIKAFQILFCLIVIMTLIGRIPHFTSLRASKF